MFPYIKIVHNAGQGKVSKKLFRRDLANQTIIDLSVGILSLSLGIKTVDFLLKVSDGIVDATVDELLNIA